MLAMILHFFDEANVCRIISTFVQAIAPGGYFEMLMLGHSASTPRGGVRTSAQ